MSERTTTVLASVATIVVAVVAAYWMTLIGAFGPAVYAVVLALVIVWLLVSAERHRGHDPVDDESLRRRGPVYWL
jgi:ABC-type sulfate transport system permease component